MAFFKKTGVYPINHTIVVKSEHLAADPAIATRLFDVFKRAKQDAVDRQSAGGDLAPDDQAVARTRDLLGTDPIPYGVAANRATLETVVRFNVEQRIIPSAVPVEEMFASNTVGLD